MLILFFASSPKPLAHLNQHLEGCLEGGIDVQIVGETNPASITMAGEYATYDGVLRQTITHPVLVCVCLLLQDLVQSCLRGEGGILEDMCYERRRAEACVD